MGKGNLTKIVFLFSLIIVVATESELSPVVSIYENDDKVCDGILLDNKLVITSSKCELDTNANIYVNIEISENVQMKISGNKVHEEMNSFKFIKINETVPGNIQSVRLTDEILYPKKLSKLLCEGVVGPCNFSCTLQGDVYACECIDVCSNEPEIGHPLIINSTLYGILEKTSSNTSLTWFYKSFLDSYENIISLIEKKSPMTTATPKKTSESQETTEPTTTVTTEMLAPTTQETENQILSCDAFCPKIEWQFLKMKYFSRLVTGLVPKVPSYPEFEGFGPKFAETCKPQSCRGQILLPPIKFPPFQNLYELTEADCTFLDCEKIKWELVEGDNIKGVFSERYSDAEKLKYSNYCQPRSCTHNTRKFAPKRIFV